MPTTAPPQITAEELANRLLDDDQAESTLETYFELTGGPLSFDFILRDDVVVEGIERLPDLLNQYSDEDTAEAKTLVATNRDAAPEVRGRLGFMGIANGIKRRKRNRRFRRALDKHPDRPLIVSEGDSWFVYPWKLKDTIEQLLLKYNVYSIGAAGDELSEMYIQQEYSKAVRKYEPEFLLLSGGGNDVLGPKTLPNSLRSDPKPDTEGAQRWVREDYLNKLIGQVLNVFRRIIYDMKRDFPEVRIILHGYDYAQPNIEPVRGVPRLFKRKADWISEPMEKKGINDPELQRDIVRVLIDAFNRRMAAMVQEERDKEAKVHFIDVRDTLLPDQWANEIHPDDKGFQQVALQFETLIEKLRRPPA